MRKVVLPLLLTLLCAGTAAAYFATSGSGSGAAGVDRTLQALELSAEAESALVPGASVALTAVVSNPNDDQMRIPALVLDTSAGTDGLSVDSEHVACGVASLTYVSQDNGGAGWTVPANDDDFVIELPGALRLASGAPNACQGAQFIAHLKVLTG